MIEEGRKESQRLLLMDRYKREVNKNHDYNMYKKNSLPPHLQKNPYRQYIPMSQHGGRHIEEPSTNHHQNLPKLRIPSGHRHNNRRNDHSLDYHQDEIYLPKKVPVIPRGPMPGINKVVHRRDWEHKKEKYSRINKDPHFGSYEVDLGGGNEGGRQHLRSHDRPPIPRSKNVVNPVWWG